jgi:transcriptional regulator with XRE-family HTH domain
MAGHRPFRELAEPILRDPARRRRAEVYRAEVRRLAALGDVRRARAYTQEQLAQAMGKPQTHVSRLEHQTDLYVSTLRRYVEAMGGQLEVRAVFPDATLTIDRFGQLAEPPPEEAPAGPGGGTAKRASRPRGRQSPTAAVAPTPTGQ